jgi:Sulfotransferase family
MRKQFHGSKSSPGPPSPVPVDSIDHPTSAVIALVPSEAVLVQMGGAVPRKRAIEGEATEEGNAKPAVETARAPVLPPAEGEAGVFTLPRPKTRTELARFLAGAAVDGVRHRKDFKEVEKVFFLVGYPRSGSTLIGSLLNGHPEMVIAHESDLFRYVKPGVTRSQLFAILLQRDRQFAAVGRRFNGFDYDLPGTSQGVYRRLRVIGDKHAGRPARRIHENPELLDRFRKIVRVPLRVLQINRNPYDMIASRVSRPTAIPVDEGIEIYQKLGVAVDDVRARLDPTELYELRYEDFTADPERRLRDICAFIGVETPPGYVEAAAAAVDAGGRRGRDRISWSDSQRAAVETMIEARPVLAGYSFES